MLGDVTVGPITTVFDLRSDRPTRLPPRKSKLGPDGQTLIRDPETVDAIMLHQTAVDYGDGDPAQRVRSERIPYHTMVFREGWVVKSWPLLYYTNHGGRGNARSIGIGVEGLYPGLEGGKVWGTKPETPMSDQVAEALAVALRETVQEARLMGCPIQYLIAHRQTSKRRRSDPGQALWTAALAEAEALGLEPQPDWTAGDGLPLPVAWGGSARY